MEQQLIHPLVHKQQQPPLKELLNLFLMVQLIKTHTQNGGVNGTTNSNNNNRRYSNPNGKANGGVGFVPYGNKQFVPYGKFIPNGNYNNNNNNNASTSNKSSSPSSNSTDGESSETTTSTTATANSNTQTNNGGQRHYHNNHHHHNNNRHNNNYGYVMQPYYTPMAYIPYPQYQLNGYGSIPMMTQNMNHSNNHHNNHHHGNNHHNNHHNNNTNNHHHNNHHNHNNQHNNQHHNNNQQNKYFLINLSRQIDYYFSKENLVKDIFLRKNMNDNGFLPLNVIANFYRVSALSFGNINSVIDSLKNCKNLVYGDIDGEYKVRAVFDPTFWST
ncbi:unnamed protein product [[Candida] boidinii]|uniref:Unnamed protein product n=1 Tax=Candida boidinii TaxID=5477 RepID=A0A9W6WLK6_CANBO|nr:unnamed protein product [[Candida] boidinii]